VVAVVAEDHPLLLSRMQNLPHRMHSSAVRMALAMVHDEQHQAKVLFDPFGEHLGLQRHLQQHHKRVTQLGAVNQPQLADLGALGFLLCWASC